MLKSIIVIILAALLGVAAGAGIQYLRADGGDPQANAGASTQSILRNADYSPVLERASAPLVIYTLAGCPYCKQSIEFLEARQVAFQIRELDHAPDLAAEAKALGSTRVPFFVFREDSLEGFDEGQLTRLLSKYQLIKS